jgi:hypothetical protein
MEEDGGREREEVIRDWLAVDARDYENIGRK